MKVYKVGNIYTHERREVEAETFDEACQKLGVSPVDCWGRTVEDIDLLISECENKQVADNKAMKESSRIKG